MDLNVINAKREAIEARYKEVAVIIQQLDQQLINAKAEIQQLIGASNLLNELEREIRREVKVNDK